MRSDDQVVIDVKDVSKDFKVYRDKAHTLKDRILSGSRNKYELNHVLNHVSFQVKRGEVLGLIGKNGCGKSTTLKLLNKILYPTSGKIIMKGRISSLIELGAGFHPDMSGRENIYINASIFGLKKKEIDKRIDRIIRFSELEAFIDNPVRTYSSGMYMRLAFSIAINVDADILLVDEILAVGDANFQRKCFDKLLEIKQKGTTVVIVSHSMDQIKSICNKVIWLENGVIRMQGSASTVCADYLLAMNEAAETRRKKELQEIGKELPDNPNVKYSVKDICPQCSKYVNRMGEMKARFTKIRLCDSKGENSTNFHYGDTLKIEFNASEYTDKPEMYNVVFVVTQSTGTRCTMFESYLGIGNYCPITSLENATFTIDSMNLGAGDYYLDAVLWDSHVTMMDNLVRVIDFSVASPKKNGIGLVAMKNSWELSTQ